jgi:hypothetical protein
MIYGTKSVDKSLKETKEKLKTILAGANCEIIDENNDTIYFIHGTYLTETPLLYRKGGAIRLKEEQNKTNIEYEIDIVPFIKAWLIIFGILLCWTIYIPILIHRFIVIYPKKFIENLIAGI